MRRQLSRRIRPMRDSSPTGEGESYEIVSLKPFESVIEVELTRGVKSIGCSVGQLKAVGVRHRVVGEGTHHAVAHSTFQRFRGRHQVKCKTPR